MRLSGLGGDRREPVGSDPALVAVGRCGRAPGRVRAGIPVLVARGRTRPPGVVDLRRLRRDHLLVRRTTSRSRDCGCSSRSRRAAHPRHGRRGGGRAVGRTAAWLAVPGHRARGRAAPCSPTAGLHPPVRCSWSSPSPPAPPCRADRADVLGAPRGRRGVRGVRGARRGRRRRAAARRAARRPRAAADPHGVRRPVALARRAQRRRGAPRRERGDGGRDRAPVLGDGLRGGAARRDQPQGCAACTVGTGVGLAVTASCGARPAWRRADRRDRADGRCSPSSWWGATTRWPWWPSPRWPC